MNVNVIETRLDATVPRFILNKYILSEKDNIIKIMTDLFTYIDKISYSFDSNVYLFYKINGKLYLDLNHVISWLIDFPNKTEYLKFYNEYSKNILLSIWTMNSSGLIIKRNLIDTTTMNQMILSRKNNFSITYQKECLFFCIFILLCLSILFMIYYTLIIFNK